MLSMEKLTAYELIFTRELGGIGSTGYLLRHKKTGARVALVQNDDDNKVFNIAFRTTPKNNTGIAHIMEHSVLCGSRDFPVKDPFVELVKGSMNTFLNAMTYPDKTMYPVASCNLQDFKNLMHVYLDAVFYPKIYDTKEIFLQEGWHYELGEPDDSLIFNGVVYNEMKGAYSSPDDVLEREIQRSLFPDTTYGFDSGGDPKCIPELTYEEFLEFHRAYYHPSNSYIYLYGDMDFEERLIWMDEMYLSHFEYRQVDSEIALQPAFDAMNRVQMPYPVAEEESLEDNTYLTFNAVISQSGDMRLASVMDVLEYALLETPGAPLKEALLEEGIGTDISGSYDCGIRQPVFSIEAKGAQEKDADRFLSVIRKVLEETCEKGVDEKALKAAINSLDFRFREADYGNYPKGLIYGLNLFDTWLYDDNAPFASLFQLDDLAWAKEQIGTGYFEQVIREYLLDNTHTSLVVLVPRHGLTEQVEEETAQTLRSRKDGMSEQQLRELVMEGERLKQFQETPSPQEDLEKIPMLSREDLDRRCRPIRNEVCSWKGATALYHEYNTCGIAYIQLLFDASGVPFEDLVWLSLLRNVLGMVDTERFSYKELMNDINMNTGGIAPAVSLFQDNLQEEIIRLALSLSIRTLKDTIGYSFDMVREILLTSDLGQEKRLREIIGKLRSATQARILSAGSAVAAQRCGSCYSQSAVFSEQLNGMDWYRFLQDLEDHFDEKKEVIAGKLREVLAKVLQSGRLLVSFTGDRALLDEIRDRTEYLVEEIGSALPAGTWKGTDGAKSSVDPKDAAVSDVLAPCVPGKLNESGEGFLTSGQVQYVAKGGSFRNKGYEFTGVLRILRTIMSYDYLWVQLRVLGGAYGCSASFKRTGETVFVSYRDPHLKRTLDTYDGIPEYLRNFDAAPRDMTKFVIGTVSDLDLPMTPQALGSRDTTMWISRVEEEVIQRERDAILSTQPEDIRALADMMEAVLSDGSICVLGNEQKLKAESGLFRKLEQV